MLRDGATVFTGALQDLTREQLIQHMVGRHVESVYSREPVEPGEILLQVDRLSRGWCKTFLSSFAREKSSAWQG